MACGTISERSLKADFRTESAFQDLSETMPQATLYKKKSDLIRGPFKP